MSHSYTNGQLCLPIQKPKIISKLLSKIRSSHSPVDVVIDSRGVGTDANGVELGRRAVDSHDWLLRTSFSDTGFEILGRLTEHAQTDDKRTSWEMWHR